MIRLHERTLLTQRAKTAFGSMVWEFMAEHDLTYLEMVRILLNSQQDLTKYMLRQERHPDNPERKADEA